MAIRLKLPPIIFEPANADGDCPAANREIILPTAIKTVRTPVSLGLTLFQVATMTMHDTQDFRKYLS